MLYFVLLSSSFMAAFQVTSQQLKKERVLQYLLKMSVQNLIEQSRSSIISVLLISSGKWHISYPDVTLSDKCNCSMVSLKKFCMHLEKYLKDLQITHIYLFLLFTLSVHFLFMTILPIFKKVCSFNKVSSVLLSSKLT